MNGKNNPEDVKLLEKFLNTFEGKNIPIDGIYSKDDFDAVVAWQEKYSDDILKPWGLKKGTGYVFTTSLKKIKEIQEKSCQNKAAVSTPAPVVSTVTNVFQFTYTLKIGVSDSSVRELQKFLNTHGFIVATSGDGSPGHESNTFGQKTARALKNFQEAHAADILIPSGLKSGTGSFGPATMKFVNAMLAQGK